MRTLPAPSFDGFDLLDGSAEVEPDPVESAMDDLFGDSDGQPDLFNRREVTAAWLDEQEFPALEWAVEGLLPEGMGMLSAPPKAGKSWLVADIGLACAAGGIALGAIPVKQRPVLYLALEDGHRRLQSRFRALMAGQPLPEELHVVIKADTKEALQIIGEFLTRYADRAPLVIIDTLGKIKPPKERGEDQYQADYKFGSRLKMAIDSTIGGCLLVVHHTRKQESVDFVDMVSGTYGVTGAADFVAVLFRKRHETQGVLAITGRDVNEEKYAIDSGNGMGWQLAGGGLSDAANAAVSVAASGRLGNQAMQALRFVNSRLAGTKAKDLAEHLCITADDAGKMLRRLEASDHICKTGRGLFAALVSDSRRLSEASEPPEQHVAADQNGDDPGTGAPGASENA
jgi:AAA domain